MNINDLFLLDAKSLEATGEGWVTVFPRGKHHLDKYDTDLNCDDKFFDSIEKWWSGSKFKKPFLDKAHEFNERYGDFTEMRVTDKGLDLYLVLNDAGKELVKSGTYEYLSPMFKNAKDSTGKEYQNVIYAVSLVNSPALLVLDKIKDQILLSAIDKIDKAENITDSKKSKDGGSGMELSQRIAGMLSLNLASDDMSILAKIEELIKSGATVEGLMAQIAKMKEDLAGATEQLGLMTEEKKKACDALDKIKADSLELEAVSVIELAIKDGQYHPALKDMKLEQFKTNPDSVKKELSIIPKVDADKQITKSGNETKSLDAMSDEDKAVLLDAGFDLSKPEDVVLAKKYLDLQEAK
jgi:hypothetical protein